MKRKYQLRLVIMMGVSALPALLPSAALAACSRSDVDYYMGRGFTRDQVVAICTGRPPLDGKAQQGEGQAAPAQLETPKERSSPSASSSSVGSAPSAAVATGDEAGDAKDDLEGFLRSALEGYDVRLTPETLQYTRKTCIEYGPYNQFGIKTEECPEVRYSIHREGLSVRKVQKSMLVLGNYEVTVAARTDGP